MDAQVRRDAPRGVIFDGDDTLWRTEALYDAARQEAFRVVSAAGEDGLAWERLQRRIDVENVLVFGYSPDRFPTSCVQAYEQLPLRAGRKPDATVSARVREAARTVFARDPEVVPGARAALSSLRRQGVRLALLTKGDIGVQERRVARSGLAEFFDLVQIVEEKIPETIRQLLIALGVPRELGWMVGNSVRSDVLPALEAGIRAIWIDAHVWEHERTHDHLVDDRVIAVPEITEVPSVVVSSAPDAQP
jgi:putative hydrolase of the HAD superfamily